MATIRIYLANLAKYNEGKLVGKWIDLPCFDIDKEIEEVLGDDEEYAIHDSECDVDGIDIGEYSSPHELNTIAEKLEKLDENDLKRLGYLLSDGFDFEEALDKYDDVVMYSNMTLKDVAEELVAEGVFGEIPKSIEFYIDYEAIGRDLVHDGYHQVEEDVFFYCQ